MKYLEWNNCFGDYLFSEQNHGKVVSLFTTEEEVFEVGVRSEKFGSEVSRERIIEDFKAAFRAGCPGATNNGQRDIISQMIYEYQYSNSFYRVNRDSFNCAGVNVRYPLYLLHIVGTLVALTQCKENSRYERLKKYFNVGAGIFPRMNEGLNWNEVWQNLVWWANKYKAGSLGTLPEKSFSSLLYEYMSKPYVYLVLNKTELQNFYNYFEKNNIGPGRNIDNESVISAFSQAGAIHGDRKRLLELLENPKEGQSEDRKTLIALLKSLYESWNGKSERPVQGLRLKLNSKRLSLVLVPDRNGDFLIGYQFYIDEQIPEYIEYHDQEILVGSNNWSNCIFRKDGLKFNDKFVLSDKQNGFKAIFHADPDDIYVFVNGRRKNLNAALFIEVDNIERTGSQRLLMSSGKAEELSGWIRQNNGVEIEDRLSVANWKLFQFEGFQFSHFSYDRLVLPATRFAEITYGLKGNGTGAYVSGFPIEITLQGAIGDEIIFDQNGLDVALDVTSQSFYLGELPPGSYHFEIMSNDPESIRITNGGNIEVQTTALKDSRHFCQIAETNSFQFGENEKFSILENLQKNGSSSLASPPQFGRWAGQETNLSRDCYAQLAIRLVEYIAFRGPISKTTFDQNIIPFFDKLNNYSDGSLKEIERTRKFTLQKLIEGCRLMPEYGENNSIVKVKPVKPFLCRVINASNFDRGVSVMQPFTGKLFYLGGCYSADLLDQLINLSLQPAYTRNVQIKVYSERSESALTPPSIFIHEKNECGFINKISQERCLGIHNSYTLYPFIRNMETVIEGVKQNMGKFHSFHSGQRCQTFDMSSLIFRPSPTDEPVFPSLSMYTISSYQFLFIIRKDELEAEVDLRWGRYIYLHLMNRKTGIVSFDQNKNLLAVPASLPFPPEVEKTFYLSTGRLPKSAQMILSNSILNKADDGRYYLLYQGILRETAIEIVRCLGQELNMVTINL